MHPLLRDWRRFLVWMAAWIPPGAILTVVAHLSGRMPIAEAAAVMVPITLVMSFVCLSPYYMCRLAAAAFGVAKENIAVSHMAAAVCCPAASCWWDIRGFVLERTISRLDDRLRPPRRCWPSSSS